MATCLRQCTGGVETAPDDASWQSILHRTIKLLHHITNTGVPLALRDEGADEKSAPAKVMSGVAGAVLGVGDSVIGTSAKLVQPVIPKKNSPAVPEPEEIDE